jgi:hypothetical protein
LLSVNIGRKKPSIIRATPARLIIEARRRDDEDDCIGNLFLLALSRARHCYKDA